MKRVFVAAGALLLGTSALAYAAGTDKIMIEPSADVIAAKPGDWTDTARAGWDKSAVMTKADLISTKSDMAGTSKLELASLDKDLDKLAAAETDGKLLTASAESDAKVETASLDTFDKVETASVDTASLEPVDKVDTGMGGPLEEVTASAPVVVQPSNADPEHDARGIAVISDVAYVPPGFNGTGGAVGGPVEAGDEESYPACTADRTDNCIQLYERGVRESLAGTDKVADDSETTAMGGPYEPVTDGGGELAMNGDGTVDASVGETDDGTIETASVETDTSVADHAAYQGVGGPVEAQSGYPPCSPGPGDDRCIQLYEPGVTGAGN